MRCLPHSSGAVSLAVACSSCGGLCWVSWKFCSRHHAEVRILATLLFSCPACSCDLWFAGWPWAVDSEKAQISEIPLVQGGRCASGQNYIHLLHTAQANALLKKLILSKARKQNGFLECGVLIQLQETVVFGEGRGLLPNLCAEVCCHPDASQLFSSLTWPQGKEPNLSVHSSEWDCKYVLWLSCSRLVSLFNKIKQCSHALWNSSNGGSPKFCSKEAALWVLQYYWDGSENKQNEH